MRKPAPKTIYLKECTPPAFLISSIDLDLDLDVDIRDAHGLVRATNARARSPEAADAHARAMLDGGEIELEPMAHDGIFGGVPDSQRALAAPGN